MSTILLPYKWQVMQNQFTALAERMNSGERRLDLAVSVALCLA